MFCPKCGTKIEEGKRYCSNCGYDTNTENTEVLKNEKIDNEVLETEDINNDLLETGKTNNNEISNEQPSIKNTLNTNEIKNTNENPNNNEVKPPINNGLINTNNTPNNNKTAIIFMLSIIAFIILFLVAIYFAFFDEDNKVKNDGNMEIETKEEIKKDNIKATIKTNKGTITFLIPKVCANSNIYDEDNNYKSYSSTNLECLSMNFTYIDYESAEEGQEATAENPYMTEYNMEKMTVELNNGVKAPAIKITDNLGDVFYPVSKNSHIEISLSLNEFTEKEIQKYIIVKE